VWEGQDEEVGQNKAVAAVRPNQASEKDVFQVRVYKPTFFIVSHSAFSSSYFFVFSSFLAKITVHRKVAAAAVVYAAAAAAALGLVVAVQE
jgi:hypothetical protein